MRRMRCEGCDARELFRKSSLTLPQKLLRSFLRFADCGINLFGFRTHNIASLERSFQCRDRRPRRSVYKRFLIAMFIFYFMRRIFIFIADCKKNLFGFRTVGDAGPYGAIYIPFHRRSRAKLSPKSSLTFLQKL